VDVPADAQHTPLQTTSMLPTPAMCCGARWRSLAHGGPTRRPQLPTRSGGQHTQQLARVMAARQANSEVVFMLPAGAGCAVPASQRLRLPASAWAR
jgi:hypothetical protein